MSNINSRSSVDPRFTEWAARPFSGFAVTTFAIYDPNSGTTVGFDPYSGPSSNPMVKLWEGPAQVQVYRQPLTVDDVAGSATQLRSVRISIPLNQPPAPIRKGLIGRVTACDINPTLMQYEYTITSGLNGGLSFVHTIEADVDMSVTISGTP